MNEKLLKRKWSRFLRLRPIFSLIPFLDFVIVAGSLALGNVHEDSDFDVIIGARKGRIFTVRAFCVFVFGILSLRRRGLDHKTASSDKVCFSHFVTPKAYRLSPPYNDYWVKLYQNLVPVYGQEKAVRDFFKANSDWAPRQEFFNAMPAGRQEKYWRRKGLNLVGLFFEFILQKWLLGWFFEKFVKILQMRRIKRSLERDAGYKPRLRYSNDELEFHPDTRRIEEMTGGA